MAWILCSKQKTSAGLTGFLQGINVWVEKPHVVNRRLCGSNLIWKSTFSTKNTNIENLQKYLFGITENREIIYEEYHEILRNFFESETETNNVEIVDIEVQFRQLIPKQIDIHSSVYIIICTDRVNGCVTAFPADGRKENKLTTMNLFKFTIEIDENNFCLWVLGESDDLLQESSIVWLKTVLFPRVKKWCEDKPVGDQVTTLKYAPVEEYMVLYTKLKQKYGADLEKKWTERTDPKKYVYEDIAIAAYLLIVWEQERKEKNLESKQSFLDFGCGNGLLVYLLTNEGHPGLGIDVRKRKIWDVFGPNVQLKIEAIDPSESTVYPGYDWFIGNHSDELTPWIPVMAAKSSYKTNFFLLPCCFYDFVSKFQRTSSSKCQYASYVDYVSQIIEVCGFVKQMDRLRIPSTKRVCFLGTKRTYGEETMQTMCNIINEFIRNRSTKFEVVPNFTPRNAVEPVVNCTQLDKGFVDQVVGIIATDLLNVNNNAVSSPKYWKTGGERTLKELAIMLGKAKLTQLKSQCGGLQTLLRNHSHIFQVMNGCVTLRNYTLSTSRRPTRRKPKPKVEVHVKRRICWFYRNHPNGCLLAVETCRYLHE